jgi:hypothetical protein
MRAWATTSIEENGPGGWIEDRNEVVENALVEFFIVSRPVITFPLEMDLGSR